MKRILKGWIADNPVTADKTDRILLLESAGGANLADVLDEMKKEDTGLRQETLEHVVNLFLRVVTDLALTGYKVNVGMFYAVAKFQGLLGGGKWNPEKNSIYVSFTQGRDLQKAIAETSVEILGEKANVMYIIETEDRKTGRKDGSATAGRNLFVRGAMLKVAGDDPSVGVTLTASGGTETKLDDDMITTNKPSELTLLIPAELTAGEYTLTVTTQYSNGQLLKTPRSVSTPVWIGGRPEEGGEEEEEERPGGL